MPTHAQINARFVALDTAPAMLTTAFDGWLAWPIVKERLWLACLAASAGAPSRRQNSSTAAARRIASGVTQLAPALIRPGRAGVALLYDRRSVALPDGAPVHPHLGTFADPDDPAILHYLYSWGGLGRDRAGRRMLRDHDIGSLSAIMARAGRRSRSVRAVAAALAPGVAEACPELKAETVSILIADQLARFHARLKLFRRLFRGWRVKAVVVLDPDGKVAEVAAAKSLKLPVIEVQHGMFGTQEPDYSWTAAHRTAAAPLPVADTVLVYGPVWRDQLVAAGYWDRQAVRQVANPLIAPFRAARAASYREPARDQPLRVLFASQGYVRAHAVDFWRDALRRQAAAPVFTLRIKVHPMELGQRGAYDTLAAEYPQTCTVVSGLAETYDEMLKADVVSGYTSLMLVEAIGLGIPTIGMRGGAASEGLAVTFGFDVVTGIVDEISEPAELAEKLAAGRTRLRDWSARTAAGSRAIFDTDAPSVEAALQDLTGHRP